jgi:hypothetical protein
MIATRSEGGEVDGGGTLRGRRGHGRIWRCDNDQERRTDGLRKWMAVAHFKAGVEAAMCFRVGDEATACSVAGIKDGRCRRWHDDF